VAYSGLSRHALLTGRVSHLTSEWCVDLTTNTDTTMLYFNNPVIDSDEEVLNTSRNIVDDEEPKFY
jgi:hypothetical protein